jgi:signal transduction protein with GAF and PtsI domain
MKEPEEFSASRLEIIRNITGELTSTLDLDEVLRLIVRLTADAMGAKGAAVRLLREATQEFRLSASWGLSHAYLSKGPIVAESSIAACMKGEVVHIPDVKNDPRIQYPVHAGDEGIVSILSVPMMMMSRVVGVLR